MKELIIKVQLHYAEGQVSILQLGELFGTNHSLYHYKNEHWGFGISTALWERVFGTMFDLSKEMEDKMKGKGLMFLSS